MVDRAGKINGEIHTKKRFMMQIYKKTSMVKPDHIIEINKQLQIFGSKVKDSCLKDGKEHSLSNVLWLAYGEGKYGRISLDIINSITHPEFQIECD